MCVMAAMCAEDQLIGTRYLFQDPFKAITLPFLLQLYQEKQREEKKKKKKKHKKSTSSDSDAEERKKQEKLKKVCLN